MPVRNTQIRYPGFNRIRLILIFFMSWSLLTSCQGGQNLHFEVVDKGSDIGNPDQVQAGYSATSPRLLVISSADQIKKPLPDIHIGREVISKLEAVNYQTSFIVVVLRGTINQTSPNFIPEITRVSRENSVVTVYTVFRPVGGELAEQAISSPYIIIKVTKTGIWGANILFKMDYTEEVAQPQSQFVP